MQNKLRLDLEDLSVESFDTTPAEHRRDGTVFGQQCTCYTNCTCPGCPTCDASCNGTCDASCNGTCGGTCAGTCGENTCANSCYCYTNDGCTINDVTCRNIGTCGRYPCGQIP